MNVFANDSERKQVRFPPGGGSGRRRESGFHNEITHFHVAVQRRKLENAYTVHFLARPVLESAHISMEVMTHG